LRENPVIQTTKAKEIDGDIQILSVEQTTKLLECADTETLPFWAIGAFAGLRRSEIERLDWDQVDLESNFIEVKARHSKNRKAATRYNSAKSTRVAFALCFSARKRMPSNLANASRLIVKEQHCVKIGQRMLCAIHSAPITLPDLMTLRLWHYKWEIHQM